jgi:hypothetical protein
MQKKIRYLLLIGAWLGLIGCATTIPEQPGEVQPYALLVLPEAIRLVALDAQTFDARLRIREMRVSPGAHSLHLTYVGPSPSHAGQHADPMRLETQAGQQYVFEAKT